MTSVAGGQNVNVPEGHLRPTSVGPSRSQWVATLFVLSAWGLGVVLAVAHALRGRRFPYADDWLLVPVVTGNEPATLSWLWSQHGQHRIPLPKALFLLLDNRLTGYDFRAAPVFSALALGAVALAMILVAKRIRGWTSYTDAFFPLALLNLGMSALNWHFEIVFLSSTILVSCVLLLIARNDVLTTGRGALLAGSLVLLLPGTGLGGAVMAPFLASFLGYCGLCQWRQRTAASRRAAVVLLSCAIGCFCFVGLLSLDDLAGAAEYKSPGIGTTLKTAAMFSAAGLGHGFTQYVTQASGENYWRLAVPALLLGTAVLLLRRLFTKGAGEKRLVGMLLCMGALGALAGAVGHGRGGRYWSADLDAHYGTLAVPILCLVYFAWVAYGSPRGRRLVETCLLLVVGAAFVLNGPQRYLSHQNGLAAETRTVEEDVFAGMSRCEVIERHLPLFWWVDTSTAWGRTEGLREGRDRVGTGVAMLGRNGVAPFRSLHDSASRHSC